MIKIKSKLVNGVATCTCPICETTVSTDYDFRDRESCCHLRKYESTVIEMTFHFDYADRTIFFYEDLQEIIDELPSRKMKKDFVRRLNSTDPQAVHSAEWELVLMDWFNRLGEVEYEVEQPNGKRPDISFSNQDVGVEFISDVARACRQSF